MFVSLSVLLLLLLLLLMSLMCLKHDYFRCLQITFCLQTAPHLVASKFICGFTKTYKFNIEAPFRHDIKPTSRARGN